MKNLIFIVLLYFSPLLWRGAGGDVYAQDQQLIDSLKLVLTFAKHDTDNANIKNAIAKELLLKHDLQGSLQYTNQALTLSKINSYLKGISTAYATIGKVYSEQHNYLNAIKQLELSANLFRKINDKYGLADCYYALGNAYYLIDDNPNALKYFFASLKIDEETGNLLNVGKAYLYIGKTYGYQAYYSNDVSLYSSSFQYLNNAFQIFEKINNNDQKAICLINKAWFYLLAGENDNAMKEVSLALILLNKSKERETIARSYIIIGILNERKGLALLKENNRSAAFKIFADARQNFLNAYQIILNESQNRNILSEILVDLGSINFNLQNYAESQTFIENALTLSKKFGFKDIIRDSYRIYMRLDSTQGNFNKALVHYKLYVVYNDSLSNEENTKKFVSLQLQYDTEKKEKQIALLTKESKLQQTDLQKQNTTRNALIFAFALMAILAGIIFNRYRIKQKANAEIETTLQHLKNTQEQLVEHEKLASLGKFTSDVAREIEVPVKNINQLTVLNKMLLQKIKSNINSADSEALKNNLLHIYNYGKEADAVVKKVLTETRKVQG